jgi:hypothetical protein
MSLGNVLNVAIGLFFTYLVLSLIGTAVHEAAASLSLSRGRLLRNGLRTLLNDGAPGGGMAALFDKVFGHGLIQGLSKTRLPSYVPSRTFSLALFDALSDKGEGTLFSQIERGVAQLPPGYAKQSLTTFLIAAGGDLDALRRRVETWFDDSMDRLSGVYKRWAQLIHFLFGFMVAVSFNVDSMNITSVLWHSTDKREAIAVQARSFVASHADVASGTPPDLSETINQLQRLPVPVGWTPELLHRTDPSAWLFSLTGWLVTGFAISLGAPFWFDLLQKLMNINVRGAGPKPASTSGSQTS